MSPVKAEKIVVATRSFLSALLLTFAVASFFFLNGCATQTGWRQMAFVHQGTNFCAVYDDAAQENVEPVIVIYETVEAGCSDPSDVREEVNAAKDGE